MSTSTATRPSRSTRRPAPATPRIPAQRGTRPAGRPVARPASQGSVRLTRRGRIVLTLLLLGLLLGAFVVFSGQSVATHEVGAPVPTLEVGQEIAVPIGG